MGDRLPVPASRDEIRTLAETFNRLLDRVEDAVHDVERVTADAAHELRTPIARVRTEVELAMGRPREPRADGETLESVLAGMVRLSRLVDDILLLARADAGALVPRRSVVPLAPLLESVRETAEVLGAPRSIRVALAPVDEGLVADADPEMLERILVNLAHNGIRYNRDEGLLEISASRREGELRIRIADTGLGIPKELVALLFRRFYGPRPLDRRCHRRGPRRPDRGRQRGRPGNGLHRAPPFSGPPAHRRPLALRLTLAPTRSAAPSPPGPAAAGSQMN
jgi:signal transduction histidine kinase